MLTMSALGATVMGIGRRIYPARASQWVEITSVPLVLPRLAVEFDGYRLVQISDFHIGTWLNRNRLAEAVELVNQQKPDLVAITGDFVSFEPERFAPELVEALRKLTPIDGTVAILGNHDHWTNPRLIRQVLRSSGIIDLSNQVLTLHRGQAQLHIAGLDDLMVGMDDFELVRKIIPPKGAAILLAHEPDFADASAASGRFDLQISGHTHGGQIRVPHLGPPYLPRLGRKYPIGLYQVGKMHQYTNRGLGTAEFPVRVCCLAEITTFTLQSGQRDEITPG
jgi:predicted MPP superfamily phosphohydrolase